jgi:PAS domain S-box-containing protein
MERGSGVDAAAGPFRKGVDVASPARSTPSQTDALQDPHRVAAARRLLVEVYGHAAFDRLSGLAARLLGTGHAKVTLFTDQDTVVGGHGLPPGVVGGPALLTGALSAFVVRTAAPLVVPCAAEDERVAGLAAVTSGQVQAYLGVPLVAASGHIVGVLAAFDAEPRTWSDDEAALLEQLGASVVAELELSAARSAIGTSDARLEIALEASSIGIWERDLRTGSVFWDERCAAIFGVDGAVEAQAVDQLMIDHVHPDDRALASDALRVALETGGQYTAETRTLDADGRVRWVVSRGRVVRDATGEPVRILGTVLDVTDARQQSDQRLAALQRATAISEVAAELANAARLEDLADVALRGAKVLGAQSSLLAVFASDGGPLRLHMTRGLADEVQGHVDYPVEGIELELDDTQLTQHVAMSGERLLLADLDEMVSRFPSTREGSEVLGVRAVAALPLRVEGRILGAFVALWAVEHPFSDDDVELLEALAAQIALSVSRRRADDERAAAVAAMAEANARLQLLADAGRVLSGSLDITEQIGQLAELVVPALGDWCWIVVTDDQGRLYELASAHRDPARREELQRYVESMVTVMTDAAGARIVTRTGQPLVLPEIDRERILAALPDPPAQESLERLGVASGAIVPLVARGQTLGALGLFTGKQRGPHTTGEVDTAVEIGRRAGLALHHARLYGQQRDLADALQRSMLTAPPQPDHCEIVVRYVPAAEGAEIGGDWYDAFLQEDGGTVLAIGDVAGHDTRAAAAMGQVRGLLRGIGYSSGGTPAQILTELDRAVQGLALDTMATALVGRLEESDEDLRTGRAWFRWSSAGHPAPVVIDAEGGVVLLDGMPADLLLGVAPNTHREDRVACLTRGTTVLLYTDGLVERRDRDVDAGTEELMSVLREYAGLPLAELCDRVLERLFLPDAEDDVALLAVRLHRQDQVRPPEAGPQRVPSYVRPAAAVHPEAYPGG